MNRAGRPREASKELLQEAAFELFQHRGYRRTSVELIAKTAGFSRATFFNFFETKAELFWVETDELILALRHALEGAAAAAETGRPAGAEQAQEEQVQAGQREGAAAVRGPGLERASESDVAPSLPPLQQVLVAFARGLGSQAIPWALKNYRLIEAADDLVASGASRVMNLNQLFVKYLRAQHKAPDSIELRSNAAAVTAGLLVGLFAWIDAGVERGNLGGYLERVYAPTLDDESGRFDP